MIYLDTSVALACVFGEDRQPPQTVWQQTLVASRLLEYEIWTRVHAMRLGERHAEAVRGVLGRVAFIELLPQVLTRALEPFPSTVRTLDALHLASLLFLKCQGQDVQLLSYDERMCQCASGLGIVLHPAGR
jgi:predicted nucleic acid-binding protein